MTPTEVDVLIVGLGPAGAATGIRLARAGLSVLAVDRARFPREKICSEFMSPETVRQLALLGGVLPRIRDQAVPLEGATIRGPRGSGVVGLFRERTPPEWPETGLSLPRRVLDHALVEEAARAGVAVWEGASLVELTLAGTTVTGALVRRDGRLTAVAARIVVGADGLHSPVARSLGGRRREPLRRYAFVAHVAEVTGVGRTAEMHVGPDGYVGLNAIGAGITNVAVVSSAAAVRSAGGDTEGFWLRTLERLPGVRGRVRRDRIVRRVLATGPFATWSRRVVADGALLVGDAADFFDPFTGEGICTALRGAELAAPVIERALGRGRIATAHSLAPYRSARRRAFAGKWAVERMIGYAMLWPGLFDRAVDRLHRREMGHTLVGVTGDFLPARAVLNPSFLMAMVV